MTTSTDCRIVVVLRPTVSGLDEASAVAMVDRLRARSARDVGLAYLDISTPTVHDELDRAAGDGLSAVNLVPVAIPRDKYLVTWTKRAVANWRESRSGVGLDISIIEPDIAGAVVADLADAIERVPAEDIRVSPASYHSPAWSVIEDHDRHVLVCKGPRCMAYGAGPLHRQLTATSKGTPTKVTGTGCLSPCNLGPLAIVNPAGEWYGRLEPAHAVDLVAGAGPNANRLPR
ncbi:(2Fe-2S) ferredoxin domain-containing protein [Gordonia McavH-238-E]|uniref:(2Fe-2S) ferredoxin domain-containing protein n=1 Tax=Gordonia sp. McavH-238-E TaxID=2917736 RepID=UPI001EF6CCF5|nr:(2Fe-2S) ferredoxin domain-containing protein [Gordonia sp. McavH-238-E]MCG7633485.1 (2Fe-2S) ferredoxin domain-containing protein [Gordonia sp. McavH-238-E]